MEKIKTTLHPKDSPNDELYPNVLPSNIPVDSTLDNTGNTLKVNTDNIQSKLTTGYGINIINNEISLLDNFVTLDSEQIITGVKHTKVGNTALENIVCYEADTILEKPTTFKNIVDFNTNINLKDYANITYTIDKDTSSLVAINKNYVDTNFVTLDTEQIITGIKHTKVGNTELENIVCYEADTILEKPTTFKNTVDFNGIVNMNNTVHIKYLNVIDVISLKNEYIFSKNIKFTLPTSGSSGHVDLSAKIYYHHIELESSDYVVSFVLPTTNSNIISASNISKFSDLTYSISCYGIYKATTSKYVIHSLSFKYDNNKIICYFDIINDSYNIVTQDNTKELSSVTIKDIVSYA